MKVYKYFREGYIIEGYMRRHKNYNIFDDDAIPQKKKINEITRRGYRNHSTHLWVFRRYKNLYFEWEGGKDTKFIHLDHFVDS